jgi:hypothetical protein
MVDKKQTLVDKGCLLVCKTFFLFFLTISWIDAKTR